MLSIPACSLFKNPFEDPVKRQCSRCRRFNCCLQGENLDVIVIKSVRPVLIKEDIVQFDAAAYKVREGAPVEDVVKKLPGVSADKDGNIAAQGKDLRGYV